MKTNKSSLSERYLTALKKHLKQGSAASLQPALKLGREAVTLGLGSLELSRIHEQALITLELSKSRNELMHRAEIFFTKAITPIIETRHSSRQDKTRLNRLTETLSLRTEELATTNRQLKRGVARRNVMQKAAENNNEHHRKSLEESLRLQKRLRQLTHQLLGAHEDERKIISRELHNEIAQTLLGINLRLLSLRQEARVNHKGLKNKIASTQRLVVNSVRSVRRVARELDKS